MEASAVWGPKSKEAVDWKGLAVMIKMIVPSRRKR
jgi:hypothetical protein